MPFFRKRSEKQSNPTTPTSPASPVRSGFIKRTPSNRSQLSDDWPNGDLGGGPSTSGQRRPDTLLIPQNEGDLGKSLQLDSPLRTSSRLSKTFQEIMHDKDAIPYFIQYMESINLGHLIRFWLDAESFQAATWTRIRTRSLQSLSKSSVMRSPGSVSSNSSPGLTGEKDKDGANCADNAGIESQTNQIPPVFPVSDSEIAISKSTCTCAASTADIASAEAVICPNAHNTDTSSTAATIHQCPYHSTTAEIKPKSAECDKKQNNESEESEESVISNSKESSQIPVSSAGLENSSKNSISQSSEENPMERRLSQLMDVASSDSAKERNGSQDEKFKKSIERDAVNIYSKYISLDATKPIGISEELRNATISKMCGEGGCVEPKCFAQCQDFVVDIMEKEHYPGFMRSVYHCKHQIDVLTSGRVYLADMLYNEAAMFYFMEFMEQEGATDLLQFVIASDNFQQHLQAMEGYDGVQAQTDAMVLYDKYFSLQATVPLGFTDKTRFEVESNICREEGPLPDCFSIARNIALKSIDKKYFPQFLHSELYYKYLSELVNTIQTAQYFVRKRTDSDGSSEHSVGSQSTGNESISMKNTLLASDTRHWKKVLHRFEDDLQIDSVLLNPDSLWKRPAAGGMSLGKVDSLGRFVSEFEPEPDHEKKKSSGFFKKRKEKDKEEEAMALRVAEMIIKDVTAATQGAAVSPANTIKKGDNQLS